MGTDFAHPTAETISPAAEPPWVRSSHTEGTDTADAPRIANVPAHSLLLLYACCCAPLVLRCAAMFSRGAAETADGKGRRDDAMTRRRGGRDTRRRETPPPFREALQGTVARRPGSLSSRRPSSRPRLLYGRGRPPGGPPRILNKGWGQTLHLTGSAGICLRICRRRDAHAPREMPTCRLLDRKQPRQRKITHPCPGAEKPQLLSPLGVLESGRLRNSRTPRKRRRPTRSGT